METTRCLVSFPITEFFFNRRTLRHLTVKQDSSRPDKKVPRVEPNEWTY